ncbi:RNA polymerase sigma factor SigJ [Maricaulis sp.]|uniref:RNA polymerase sigma factor SigJ n=1 Tax=Maricaulis sp. TaxID=1486257 RepID=UPI0026148B0B|nr:RNA polymerase sigma factor SigJ [Maricaulis sp.]
MTSAASDLPVFQAERPRLLAIAYRMLGERMVAEDVVQEVWLRWDGADRTQIDNPQAWLTSATTRLAIDALRKARVRRETYSGPWLPEPWLEDPSANFAERVETAQQAELALLWAMEALTPDERAAFILHDAFDTGYAGIAAILDKSEPACRQLVTRARRKTRDSAARPGSAPDSIMTLLARIMTAYAKGDLAAIAALLAEDVLAISDGGGKVRAALRPLMGTAETAQVMHALATRKPPSRPPDVLWINGCPAIGILEGGAEDFIMTVTPARSDSGRIGWIYVMRNPEKLPRRA